jgi:hypothetical protein
MIFSTQGELAEIAAEPGQNDAAEIFQYSLALQLSAESVTS